MKIVIPGGSGQVGTLLARHFHPQHEVIVLSREPRTAPWSVLPWDSRTVGAWASVLEDADVVINLAGRSVNCRYSRENRRAILDSRVESTQAVGEAIAHSKRPPRLWLQMSTATIYAHRLDAANDEATGILGGSEPNVPDTWKFSIDVAMAWEAAAERIETPGTRRVLLRSAMVMSPDPGGVFSVLLDLVRKRLGGRAGHGNQYVSWIHEADFIRAIEWLIATQTMDGPVNICSPNPLPNRDFMSELRKAAGIRLELPATRWMLEVGAWFLRTETELILKSRRVTPGRLLESGFRFQFPEWPYAARELVCRSRSA